MAQEKVNLNQLNTTSMAGYIVESIVGSGTGDAIIIANQTVVPDGVLCSFRVKVPGSNTSSTPTLQPSGWTSKTIVKLNNQPLAAGDLVGWHVLTYDATLGKFVVDNPAVSGGVAGGLDQVFMLMGT